MRIKERLLINRIRTCFDANSVDYDLVEADGRFYVVVRRNDDEIVVKLMNVREFRVNSKNVKFFMNSGVEYIVYLRNKWRV